MRDMIEAALKGHNADYIDLRIDDGEATRISYRGRELDDISRSHTGYGGCVRALYRGGWGFVSFNDLSALRGSVEDAVAQARLAGTEDHSQFADVEPVVDAVPPVIVEDPTAIPLGEKKQLLDEYNEI